MGLVSRDDIDVQLPVEEGEMVSVDRLRFRDIPTIEELQLSSGGK